MADIAVFPFDKEIAKTLGVEEAILHEWIRQGCFFNQLTKRSKMHIDGKWWIPFREDVQTNVFPFWSKQQIKRLLERLENQEYLEKVVDEKKLLKITTKIPPPKKARGKNKVLAEEDAIPYAYHKEVDGTIMEVVEPAAMVVSYMIHQFRHINTNYNNFYSMPVYRKALSNLLKSYQNTDKLLALLKLIPETNKMKYAPIITTPLEFTRNIARLESFIEREKKQRQGGNVVL